MLTLSATMIGIVSSNAIVNTMVDYYDANGYCTPTVPRWDGLALEHIQFLAIPCNLSNLLVQSMASVMFPSSPHGFAYVRDE